MSSKRVITCSDCGRERRHAGYGRCAACYSRKWKAENRDHINAYNRESRRVHYARRAPAIRAHRRAAYAELSWAERCLRGSQRTRRNALSLEFLAKLQVSTPECECCGVTLDYRPIRKSDRRANNVATLDKVVPELGYVETNVGVVCFRCNAAKRDCSLRDLRHLLDYVSRKTGVAA